MTPALLHHSQLSGHNDSRYVVHPFGLGTELTHTLAGRFVVVVALILSIGCGSSEPTSVLLQDVASMDLLQSGEPETLRLKFVDLDRNLLAQFDDLDTVREIEINESGRDGTPLLSHFRAMNDLRSLILNHVAIQDEELSELRDAQHLERLELSQTGLTGAGLRHLSELPIKHLLICDAAITPEGLANITSLKQLEHLELCLPAMNAASLPSLAGLKNLKSFRLLQINFDYRVNGGLHCLDGADSIEHLELSGRKLTARVLSAVGRMQHLQSLTLYRGLVEDEGIQRLTDMASLQRLEIHEAGALTDRSLSLLASLRELRELHLSDTRMMAATLPQLAAAPSLMKIEIFGRPIDPKVIDAFYALNDRCKLSTSFETVDSHSRSFVSAPPLY